MLKQPYRLLNSMGLFGMILQAAKVLEPTKAGGYLCVAEPTQGLPFDVRMFGEIEDLDSATRRFTFCQEKVRRLVGNPEHRLSWQSRDPDNKKYGGAVHCGEYIFSFSGFSEKMDEAMCLYFAVKCGVLSMGAASLLAQISANDAWRALQLQMGDTVA